MKLDRLWAALTDADQRSRWLPDLALTERTSQPERSIRFDVGDGTRLAVTVAAMSAGKAQLAVEHERLPDAEAAAAARTAWRNRLGTSRRSWRVRTEGSAGGGSRRSVGDPAARRSASALAVSERSALG
jgi:hypothetical protein